MKHLSIILAAAVCLFCVAACSDSPSKKEQETLIRAEVPALAHYFNWSQQARKDLNLYSELSEYQKRNSWDYPSNAVVYAGNKLTSDKAMNKHIEEHKANPTNEAYAKRFTDFFPGYDDYGEVITDEMDHDFMMRAILIAAIYPESSIQPDDIIDYIVGHAKMTVPIPQIVNMEYFQTPEDGNYWVVRLDDGKHYNIRCFRKEDKTLGWERFNTLR